MSWKEDDDRREQEREPIQSQAELYLESSVYKAVAMDHSEGGVKFTMGKPINFHVRYKVGEKRVSRLAQLVWSQKNETGEMVYGFSYLDEEQ